MHYVENNPKKYLLSPRWERIEVRGDRIWIFTPTLTLPPQRGRGKMESIFIVRACR
jgi:predicted AlkP superfamily phosphohydrolase/phosphomutase